MADESMDECVVCGKRVSTSWRGSVHRADDDGKYRCVCLACANAEVAAKLEISYTPPTLADVTLHDRDGVAHTFMFVERLSPGGKSVVGFERGEAEGYQAQALSEDYEANAVSLQHAAVRKLARSLSRRELEHDGQLPLDAPVRGRISWDRDNAAPAIIIGGRLITWERFGEMFATYEGFHFILEMYDHSDER